MAQQVTRRRRRACGHCGGTYFAAEITFFAALLLFGGFASGVYGGYTLFNAAISHGHGAPVFLAGFAVMLLAALFGRRWRCIKCDAAQ
jgi:ribosomal protein S27AE